MKNKNRIIIIGLFLLVNLYSIVADDISENDNDLYLNTNLFSLNFQSLSGENIYKYSQMFGLSDELKEKININDKINFELISAKDDRTKGQILYWSGLAGMLVSDFLIVNSFAYDDDTNIAASLSTFGVSTIIAFIGIKYLSNASSHTHKAVTMYNILN